ncbi:hypothetical protein [Streptomyces sp. B6B3]|uniref:hypothetical protein n=1 Tax=Streptomyces sp. B6B3 TaxID=3153570 RepID=UPI00325EB65C
MAGKSQYYEIVVVDIKGFGSRSNPVQSWLRDRLYELLENALAATGIDHRAGPPPTDRGDGMFWLLPGSVPKTDLTGPFVHHLYTGLRALAATSNARAEMRLRVALHAGEVAWDERGWVGADLNTACRMVDLPVLRETLEAAGDAPLALAVSDAWYRGVIQHDYPEIDPADFRPVRFDAKEIRNATAWVRVPGRSWPTDRGPDGPGGTGDTASDADAGAGRSSDDAPRDEARGHAGGRGREQRGDRGGGDTFSFTTGPGAHDFQQMGNNYGDTHLGGARPAAPLDPEVRRLLDDVRAALKEARNQRRIDLDTYRDATEELDLADENADAADSGSRGRFLTALRRCRDVLTPVGELSALVGSVIALVRGKQ